VGQGVCSGEGRSHVVLQGPEIVQVSAGPALARGAAPRPQWSRRRGRRQLHQEEARLPAQVNLNN
jgi:hypothetical protein